MKLRNNMIIQIAHVAELYDFKIISVDFRTIGPMVDEVKIIYVLNNNKYGLSYSYRNNTLMEVNFLSQRLKEEVEKFKSESIKSEAEQIGAAIYDEVY